MKNVFKLLAILGLGAIVLNGCKKGEEDPFLSFASRDARLAGNWELTNVTYSSTETEVETLDYSKSDCGDDDTETTTTVVTVEFDGSEYTYDTEITYDDGDKDGETHDADYSLEVTVNKDGTYSAALTYSYYDNSTEVTYEGELNTTNGSWYWDNNSQNKSAVTFLEFPTFAYSYGGFSAYKSDATYDIVRLASKELVFEYVNETDATDVYSYSWTDWSSNECSLTSTYNVVTSLEGRWTFSSASSAE